jgi:hypothetical protein
MSLQRLECQSLSVTRLRFRLRGSRRPEDLPQLRKGWRRGRRRQVVCPTTQGHALNARQLIEHFREVRLLPRRNCPSKLAR